MTEPATGPTPPKQPEQPSGSKPAKPLSPSDQKSAFLLNSPFAKMFRASGATPTVKEMRAIMNGILKSAVDRIKKDEARWKKAMKKMKDAIEGND